MVNSGRDKSIVAPNSPIEIVNAKAPATSIARPMIGKSISRQTCIGLAPSIAAAFRSCGLMIVHEGSRLRTTKGKATSV